MVNVIYKGHIRNVKDMNKKELADYMVKMKPSHSGYGAVVKEYMKKRG